MTNNLNIVNYELIIRLQRSLNSTVQIITNFSVITGKVVEILNNYAVLQEANEDLTLIPFSSIDSLILLNEEGNL